MRDPRRIDRLLEKLRIIWDAHRDQRLGQLVNNLHRFISDVHIFHIEDYEWEQLMDDEIMNLENGVPGWRNGKKTILFLDRYRLVTKDELYED